MPNGASRPMVCPPWVRREALIAPDYRGQLYTLNQLLPTVGVGYRQVRSICLENPSLENG